MQAVQLLRGQGGWPLNVFCLPDGRPFFGGTYFPPDRRMGMPSWTEVLESVAAAYRDRREDIAQQAGKLVESLGKATTLAPAEATPDATESLHTTASEIMEAYDPHHGGFGGAPKFPQPFFPRLLLHYAHAAADERAREQALFTLRKMAEGGMYDQLGGGFHRYSVDAEWLVPHFEKMLYDNALLAPLYLDAARLTEDPFYARIAEETLDYLLRDMRSPEGAFYSSTDADSEGEEGKYFVWTPADTERLLGPDDAPVFDRYYDVSELGQLRGQVHPAPDGERGGRRQTGKGGPLRTSRRSWRAGARLSWPNAPPGSRRRPIPRSSWLGTAWRSTRWRRVARTLAAPRFLEKPPSRPPPSFSTRYGPTAGSSASTRADAASVPAFLEDYAAFADALLSLHEATGDERWFGEALSLGQEMLAKFWDEAGGGFFTAGSDNEALITRSKPASDGATPSGNSHAAKVLARLYALTREGKFADRLEATARAHALILARAPTMMPLLVTTLDWLQRHQTVTVVGDPDSADTQALLRAVRDGYFPTLALTQRVPGAPTQVPQLDGKEPRDGVATAYVCHGFTCSLPVTTPDALLALLAEGTPAAG